MHLLVLNDPLQCIIMDLVFGLPRTQRKNDSIMVAVDHFCKIAHFIPCRKTVDATNIVNLFYKEVYKFLSLAYFWRPLWKKIGSYLHFNTIFIHKLTVKRR